MKKLNKKAGLLVIFTHVEAYPPALNAIQLLAAQFDELTIIYRNVMKSEWNYPSNVQLFTTPEYCHYSEVVCKPFYWKVKNFLQFSFLFLRKIKSIRPGQLIIHDPIALLSWYVIKPMVFHKQKIWYHNHDVILGNENFFSYWSFRAQRILFSSLDRFSLPANERKAYFPMEKFKGKYYYLPNFPGRYLYDQYYTPRTVSKDLRIIFQGYIGDGHGLSEMLEVIHEGIDGLNIKLVLKGFRNEGFLSDLVEKAKSLGIAERIEIFCVTSYMKVPEVASACHIGIGIHTKTDVMNATLGTASNKIYEYAAVGLPVLLYDNPHFKEHLNKFEWAFFVSDTKNSIKDAILKILANYEHYSLLARKDFENQLNFESIFKPILIDLADEQR